MSIHCYHYYILLLRKLLTTYTVKPVLSGYLWDKEKVAVYDR